MKIQVDHLHRKDLIKKWHIHWTSLCICCYFCTAMAKTCKWVIL